MTNTERKYQRPILFNGPMVRAILSGAKTQTRRVIVPQPPDWCTEAGVSQMTPPRQWEFRGRYEDQGPAAKFLPCPFLPACETALWVRETHTIVPKTAYWHDATIPHRASPDGSEWAIYREGWERSPPGRWRPSIHMPRWASRITLHVTSVRAERLQSITESDALAEGFHCRSYRYGRGTESAVHVFRELWDKINGKRGYGWESNPWVYVVAFERVE